MFWLNGGTMNDYINFIEKNHIKPIEISDKEQYYLDLENVSRSWTGRIDASFTNAFIQEAVLLIVNAITLFEKGFFDCAYYSLRQSLEVATTMNFLLELSPDQRSAKFKSWKTQQWFPMNKQMLEFLENNKEMYFDIFSNMKEYFKLIEDTKNKINKFVHKQGYEYFYVTRNHPLNQKYDETMYVVEFVGYLKICIGSIAVLRLAVDPMPVLLMDQEIYYRTGDTMTRPFSDEFVETYIGFEYIERFKQTQVYYNHYNDFMREEKREKCVIDVIKNKYIDKNKTNKILVQKHLLSKEEVLVVTLCGLIEKIVKAYTLNGIGMYFTNLKTIRQKLSWNGEFFYTLSQQDDSVNCGFDESYISYFKFSDDLDVYLEHNELLIHDEIAKIKSVRID